MYKTRDHIQLCNNIIMVVYFEVKTAKPLHHGIKLMHISAWEFHGEAYTTHDSENGIQNCGRKMWHIISTFGKSRC
jgi:hypothetical protein